MSYPQVVGQTTAVSSFTIPPNPLDFRYDIFDCFEDPQVGFRGLNGCNLYIEETCICRASGTELNVLFILLDLHSWNLLHTLSSRYDKGEAWRHKLRRRFPCTVSLAFQKMAERKWLGVRAHSFRTCASYFGLCCILSMVYRKDSRLQFGLPDVPTFFWGNSAFVGLISLDGSLF